MSWPSTLALILLALAPRSARADEPSAIDLVVDTSRLEDRSGERERVRAGIVARASEDPDHEWVAVREGGQTWVELRVTLVDRDVLDYVIDVDLALGELRSVMVVGAVCKRCSDAELIGFASGQLRALELDGPLAKLRALERAESPRVVPLPCPEPPPRLGGIGLSGVALAGAGVASMLVGGLMTHHGTYLRAYDPAPWELGVGTLIVGGAAAVIGTAAIVSDWLLARSRERSFAVALTPSFDGASLIVGGRF